VSIEVHDLLPTFRTKVPDVAGVCVLMLTRVVDLGFGQTYFRPKAQTHSSQLRQGGMLVFKPSLIQILFCIDGASSMDGTALFNNPQFMAFVCGGLCCWVPMLGSFNSH